MQTLNLIICAIPDTILLFRPSWWWRRPCSARESEARFLWDLSGKAVRPKVRDVFEPDFCGLGSGRVLEIRARVGSGRVWQCKLRVGSGQDIWELFRAFFSFFKLFSCNSIRIYGFYLGVGLLSSKINFFLKNCQKWKNLWKYEKNCYFWLKKQAREPRCGLRVGVSLEKPVRACKLSGSGQARCHPYLNL